MAVPVAIVGIVFLGMALLIGFSPILSVVIALVVIPPAVLILRRGEDEEPGTANQDSVKTSHRTEHWYG